MLKCICACLQKGSTHWLLQRLSAVFMIVYFVPILAYWLICPDLGYMWWSAYLSSDIMLALLLVNLLMFFVHAIIGFWTVATDYIGNKCLRTLLVLGVAGYMALLLGLTVVTIII